MNETLDEAFGSFIADTIRLELSSIGAGRVLFAGKYGSQIKGYNRHGSDHDIYLVYAYDEASAQQLMFKSQEFFDRVLKTGEEHAFDAKFDKKEYQIKAVSVQHFIAQVCGSNYCMAQAVLNPQFCAKSFKTAHMALKMYASFALDYVTVAQSKYRAAYRMSQSLTEAEDRKGAGNRQDRRMAESTSRLVDAAHAFMTAEVIRQAHPVGRFFTSDYVKLLEEYKKLPEQRVLDVRLLELLHFHRSGAPEETVYDFVRRHIVPGIIAAREGFDKYSLPRDDEILARRKSLGADIYTESLAACLPMQK